jgi:hypothetical protein
MGSLGWMYSPHREEGSYRLLLQQRLAGDQEANALFVYQRSLHKHPSHSNTSMFPKQGRIKFIYA